MANDGATSKTKDQSRDINMSVPYTVLKSNTKHKGSLVDRGTNGGLAG